MRLSSREPSGLRIFLVFAVFLNSIYLFLRVFYSPSPRESQEVRCQDRLLVWKRDLRSTFDASYRRAYIRTPPPCRR